MSPVHMPQYETLRLDADGHSVYARVFRASLGPPVVMVHGLGVSGRYLLPTARLLANEYAVYIPDLPGFGKSGRPRHTLTVPQLADALLAWMDAANLERAALLGNSLGCQVILDAAARRPERVSRAVLTAPTIDPYANTPTAQILRILCDGFRERISLLGIVAWDYLVCGPVRLWQTLRYALEDPVREKVAGVRCPMLVVRGGRDPVVSRRWCEEAAHLAADGRLAVIPEAPHAINYSTPDALAQIVRPFLAEGQQRARDDALPGVRGQGSGARSHQGSVDPVTPDS